MFGTLESILWWNGKWKVKPDYEGEPDEAAIDVNCDNGKVTFRMYLSLESAECLATAIDQACQDYRRATGIVKAT
jgi:hypothetical protein